MKTTKYRVIFAVDMEAFGPQEAVILASDLLRAVPEKSAMYLDQVIAYPEDYQRRTVVMERTQ